MDLLEKVLYEIFVQVFKLGSSLNLFIPARVAVIQSQVHYLLVAHELIGATYSFEKNARPR